MGGHVEACDQCGHQRVAYNSCRNRHCPKCQATSAAQWMEAREAELLYASQEFHVQLLTYGAAQIEPTNSGLRHTSRQAPTAASSNSS